METSFGSGSYGSYGSVGGQPWSDYGHYQAPKTGPESRHLSDMVNKWKRLRNGIPLVEVIFPELRTSCIQWITSQFANDRRNSHPDTPVNSLTSSLRWGWDPDYSRSFCHHVRDMLKRQTQIIMAGSLGKISWNVDVFFCRSTSFKTTDIVCIGMDLGRWGSSIRGMRCCSVAQARLELLVPA